MEILILPRAGFLYGNFRNARHKTGSYFRFLNGFGDGKTENAFFNVFFGSFEFPVWVY